TSTRSLTASLRALPALNPGILEAAIWISAPVCGLRPVRAARSLTENVPKPTSTTDSPFFNAPVMLSTTASSARPAAAFGMSADAAIASISSVLFTLNPFLIICCSNFFQRRCIFYGYYLSHTARRERIAIYTNWHLRGQVHIEALQNYPADLSGF